MFSYWASTARIFATAIERGFLSSFSVREEMGRYFAPRCAVMSFTLLHPHLVIDRANVRERPVVVVSTTNDEVAL